MKTKLIFVLLIGLNIPCFCYSQASGGQIIRPSKNTSFQSKRTNSKPRILPNKNKKTYTPEEMYQIGSSLYEQKNYQEALKWYKKAAEGGLIDAQSELGFMYLKGEGVTVNKTEAIRWLSNAGQSGDVMAQYTLGYMYKNGDGIPRDDTAAKNWYSKAAPKFYEASRQMMKTNDPQCLNFFATIIDMDIVPYNIWSMFHIGAMFYYGEGGQSIDFSTAYKFFKLAADKGNNKIALYYLGLCYEYGRGVSKDLSIAREYYRRSGFSSLPSRDF